MKNVIKQTALGLCALILLICCRKMEDYKAYLGDQPIINYTGKVDSLKIFAGENRVMLRGLLISDPKIVQARIYWNNRLDSIVVPIKRTSGIDTLEQIIGNLAEGVYNFEVVTFDDAGNRSVTVTATGRSFGEIYRAGIVNAPLLRSIWQNYDRSLSSVFANIDPRTGIYATEVHYTNTAGQRRVQRFQADNLTPLIRDLADDSPLSYRTVYTPDTLALDTFFTDLAHFQPTDTLFYANLGNYTNMGYPAFAGRSIRGRWGVLAEWESNTAANMMDDGSRGSWDIFAGFGVLSAEAGWGTPNIHNGKIYQTQTLPSGRYAISLDYRKIGSGNALGNHFTHFIVSTLPELPNFDEINSFPGRMTTHNLNVSNGQWIQSTFQFDNPETQPITIGVVVNFTNNVNQHLNIRGIRVRLIP